MDSIVLVLQNELTQSNCDIVSVLRKAHLIAAKLGLAEFDNWILCELNGYKSDDTIPDYRVLQGSLKALNTHYGWIPAVITDKKTENLICNKKVYTSIPEIISLCNRGNGVLKSEFSGSVLETLNQMFDYPIPTVFELHFSVSAMESIVEIVKTTILEWTIKLENEGILGEGMKFDISEKETAKTIPQTINNYYGNPIINNASVDRAVLVTGNSNTVQFSYEIANDAVSDIESSLNEDNITDEDKETAMELLNEIKDKVSNQKKPPIIKSALAVLSDFLIGVGASATAAVIQAKMQGMF